MSDDEAIYTTLNDIQEKSTAKSKTLAAYLFKAVGISDTDFTECYYSLKDSNDHHSYALPLTCRILRKAGCARVFELDNFTKHFQDDTLPDLPKLALRELVAEVAPEIAVGNTAKFVRYVSRFQLKVNPDRFSFDLEGVLNLFETAEKDCLISTTEVTPVCSWLEHSGRQDLALKVQEQRLTLTGLQPIPAHLKELSVGTPPQGQGETSLQTSLGQHQVQQSTKGFYLPPTTKTTQAQDPATSFQTSGEQPHFSHDNPHLYSHHPSASAMAATGPAVSHRPQSGSSLQHGPSSHSTLAPGHPPAISTSTPVPVPRPGDRYMSQPPYSGSTMSSSVSSTGVSSYGRGQSHASSSAGYSQGGSGSPHTTSHPPHPPAEAPTTSSQTCGGQPYYSHGGHHTSDHYPSASATGQVVSHIPQSAPTTYMSPLPPPGSSLQHGPSSHSSLASGPHPAISTSTPVPVPRPEDGYMSQPPYPGNQPFQSQYGCNTDGSSMFRGDPSRYPQESSPFPSMGSGGSTMSSSISSIGVSSYGRGQSHASSSAGYSQGDFGSPQTTGHPPHPPGLASEQHRSGVFDSHSSYSQDGYSSANRITSTGSQINLTYGPPVESTQFSGESSMRWSDNPIQQQQHPLSLAQVVPGTTAGNPPNPTITSSQGQRSISGQPGRRFHTPPPALLQCQQGATASNTDRQPSEPSVPATEQQPRQTSFTAARNQQSNHRLHIPPPAPHQCQEGVTASNTDRQPSEPSVPATEQQSRRTCTQMERQDAMVLHSSENEKQISVEETDKSGSSQPVYNYQRLRGQSLDKSCIESFRPILRKSYENLKTEKLTAKPPSETFVNPVFSSANGKGERRLVADVSVTYDSLFPAEAPEMGKRTVIFSDPGCGKTLLLTKAARDWAAGRRLTTVSLLLYAPAYVFASKKRVTLVDLLSLYYPDETMQGEVARYFAACGGADICFCFDGLQKRPPPVVAEILGGTLLPNATVFVACHPEAIEFVEAQASSIVRIERFGSEQVQTYIKRSLDSEHARVFNEYINSYPLLRQLFAVPLHLAVFMHLFNCSSSTTQLPDTDTKILELLVLNLLWLSLSSQSCPGSDAIDLQSLDQLPQQHKLAFDCLCSLAFDQILGSKNTFSSQDVPREVSVATIQSLCNSLIVCNRDRNSTGLPVRRYSFSDPEVQAYFAALHLRHKLSAKQQEQMVREYAKYGQLRSLWKFYCGIACKECPQALPHDSFLTFFSTFVQHFINTSRADTTGLELLPLFHCAFETRSPQACTILLEKLQGSISIKRSEKLTRPDCSIIGYVICQSHRATSTLDFSDSYMSSECIAALTNQLEKARLEEITTLCLHGPIKAGDFEAATALTSFLSNLCNLQKLSLCNIQVKPSDQDVLLRTVSQLQNLHTLTLSSNSLTPERGTKLAELLKNLKDLRELDLSFNRIGDQGLKDMSVGLVECDKLTVLRLRECWLAEGSGDTLAVILKKLSHLSNLELQGNSLQTMGAVKMLPGLMDERCSLVNLNLMGNKIDDSGAISLLGLQNKRTLKDLRLGGNAISPGAAASLKTMKCIHPSCSESP